MIYTAKFSRLNELSNFLTKSKNCLIISAKYENNFNYCVNVEISTKNDKIKLEKQFQDLILSKPKENEIVFRINAKHKAIVIHLKRMQKKNKIKKEENEKHNNSGITERQERVLGKFETAL